LERHYIRHYREQGHTLYNHKDGGEGGALSEETKRKISEAHKGKRLGLKHKAETIAKMKQWRKSEEHKKAIGNASRGRKKSAEAIAKQVESFRGWRPTQEMREKMSKAAKGKIVTEETKKRMSIAFALCRGSKPFIVQNAETGEIVGEWISVMACSRDLKIDNGAIRKRLRGEFDIQRYPFRYLFTHVNP